MFDRLRKVNRVRGYSVPSARVTAHVDVREASVDVTFGEQCLSFKMLDRPVPQHECYDFAALAMAALSMSKNIEIELAFPISSSMAQRLDAIEKTYSLWSLDTLAPLRLKPKLFAEAEATFREGQSGVICLSGGLDSLSAAVSTVKAKDTSYALLLAGADYSSSRDPGFLQLKERVERLAERLELKTVIVETNIRSLGINWDQMHGINLGACLHFLSPLASHGSFAQDDTVYQQRFRGPWGNYSYLPALMRTDAFDIRTHGDELDRVDKLRQVAEFDENLLSDLSVCFADKSQGGNCGRCFKCVVTRAAFHALGIPEHGLFNDQSNIEAAVRRFRIPRKLSAVRGRMIRCSELLAVLPDGDVREAFVHLDSRLRQRHKWLAPPI